MAKKPAAKRGDPRASSHATTADIPRPVAQDIGNRRARAGYMRDGRGPTMVGWQPTLREPYEDVRHAWTLATARATDLMQNVGWISGAIEQAVANTVGTGLKLNAKPDPKALGFSDDRAGEWGAYVERTFSMWGKKPAECDAEGRRNFGQMQAAGFRGWFASGEIVSAFKFRARPGCTYGTKMRLIPAQRLSQKTQEDIRLVQGVHMDEDGFPVGYMFCDPDPILGRREYSLRARDQFGRPEILHVFDGAIGHVRGISPLVPVLQVARQWDQLANATLMSSIVQAVFAATIESTAPTEEFLQAFLTPAEQGKAMADGMSLMDAYFEAQSGWYDQKVIDVGINGRMVHTLPGEKLEFHGSESPGPNYQAFARDLLREMARCAGITYEGFTGDYAGVTFSSIRFATDENFRIVLNRRQNIVAPLCQAAYEAWLEEAIDSGRVELPGGIDHFLANRTGICNADWKGSPKPQADELKAANAQRTKYDTGHQSLTSIAEENGEDYEDNCRERANEAKLRKKYSLPEPVSKNSAGGAPPEQEDDDETPKKTKEAA